MKMTKPKPVSRMKRPFISELAELGLSGEILSIRIYGHSRFCNTDFDDKLACLNLSGV
ncbi:hypothetical protein N3Z97_00305 [Enterobacter hormaechei]|nr:hypothetical protein [Enterobacter hormaechei]